jgi:hypothetical protein
MMLEPINTRVKGPSHIATNYRNHIAMIEAHHRRSTKSMNSCLEKITSLTMKQAWQTNNCT